MSSSNTNVQVSEVVAYLTHEAGCWIKVPLSSAVYVYLTTRPDIRAYARLLGVTSLAAIKTQSGEIYDFKTVCWRAAPEDIEATEATEVIENIKDIKGTGLKYDTGKPDFSLISPVALAYLSQVLTFGAAKYAPNNWRNGIKVSKLLAACHRHLAAIQAGLDTDEETGLPHAAHLMCEAMFIIEQMNSPRALEWDDRYSLSSQQKKLLVELLATVVKKKD